MIRRAIAVALVLLAAPARADTPPSVWERARDVETADAYDRHQHVQQRRASAEGPETRDAELRDILAALERAHAETSKIAVLRFDLAFAYFGLEDFPRAAALYKAAIADFPDHPAVDQAWFRLAVACGHIGDNACERRAYGEILRFETEDSARATPILNLAETQMHLGDLREAVEGYREALRLAGRASAGRETAPLAAWGLAVALDRGGDRIGAEREARFAHELETSLGAERLLHSGGVFFYPRYEIEWYDGLGFAARAKATASPREAAALWQRAEHHFEIYVREGEKAHDRWLPIAKARLAQAKAERARAEKAPAPKAPTPPTNPFEQEFKL